MLIERRRELAFIYDDNLRELEKNSDLKLPPRFSTNSNFISTYQNYEIQANRRDDLIDFLRKNNIGTIKQWGGFSIAHFSKLGYEIDDYPETKALFNRLLLLPMNHMMKEEEVQYICDKINYFYKFE